MGVKVRIVTGYAPLPGYHRTLEQYQQSHAQLLTLKAPMTTMLQGPEECWLWKFITENPKNLPLHMADGNDAKNTLLAHCVWHEKTEWVKRAAQQFSDADTFIWIDYGIFCGHLAGVTVAVIDEFLTRIRPNDFAIPGIRPEQEHTEEHPNWRFCGSMFIVPRNKIEPFDSAVKLVTKARLREKNYVSLDVNDWAAAERQRLIKPRWYAAAHTAAMFDNYV